MSQPLMPQKSSIQRLPWLQKRAVTITIALLGLILILGVITLNIVKYETHLTSADTVLLELAPVDPRGFMQGDYMALSYALEIDIFDAMQPGYAKFTQPVDAAATEAEMLAAEADNFEIDSRIYQPSEGYVIVKLDANNVGHFVRLANNSNRNDINNLAANELAIYYRIRHGSVQLATNAFFFQEGYGYAKAFEMAKYGLFRVNEKGEPLLTHMVNSEFKVIDPKNYPAETNSTETSSAETEITQEDF